VPIWECVCIFLPCQQCFAFVRIGELRVGITRRRFSLLFGFDRRTLRTPQNQEIPGGSSIILMLRKWIFAPSDSRQR
jgi:hypothetical protein